MYTIVRYCECFAAGIYCRNCNCGNCQNNADNEAARQEAVGATLECNPNAFRPKIASSPHGFWDKRVHYLTPTSLQHLLISALLLAFAGLMLTGILSQVFSYLQECHVCGFEQRFTLFFH